MNLAESSVDNVISIDNKYVNRLFEKIGNNYFRFSPGTFKESIKLDGISKVEIWTLQEYAREMIKKSEDKIKSFCISHDLSTEVSERYNNINTFKTRYDQWITSYSELISIVDEIKLCERNQDKIVKAHQIELLEKSIKNFKFEFTFQIDGIDFNDKIYTPFETAGQICYPCKSLAIGYLPAFEKLKPENYFNKNYNYELKKTIHKCYSDWTQYHFVAANNEIASFIYLLKERLFEVKITETIDSIISYEAEKNKIKHCIECEKKFLTHILNERLTTEKQSAIGLSKIYYGDDNNTFIEFIERVNDLEKLFKKS